MKKFSLLVISILWLLSQPFAVYADTHHHSRGSAVQKKIAQAKEDLSDTAITTKVKAKLLADSATSGMDIIVQTDSQVVTLSGKVKSDAEKKLAEDIALHTQGVKGVNNQLGIQ